MKLLTTSNTKILKSIEYGYLTAIVHLSPFKSSGVNICPKASPGCAAACLNTAGLGVMKSVQDARMARTLFYLNDKPKFEEQLYDEIGSFVKSAKRKGLQPAIRPNGTSDLPTLGIKVAKQFPDLQIYDYTKIAKTFERELPDNYHLTFSRSEINDKEVDKVLELGYNVAVVFNELPETWKDRPVVDGDVSDLRFLDPEGVIVGLSMKGKAKKDETGFVIHADS